MAELRRENFRLRLILYDYQKAKKRLIDPQDAESSVSVKHAMLSLMQHFPQRLFAAEAENLSLKEALIEKSDLIRSASYVTLRKNPSFRKMIDILKAENDSFKEQLKEARERMEHHEREWRKKYDEVYAELVEVREALHISDLKARAQEHQVARQTGELQSQVAELQFTVDAGRTEIDRKTRELESVQADVSKLRSVLEQLSESQPGEDGLQHSVNELSHGLHESCVKRIQELASLLHLLIRQITDAGLTPVATVPLDLSLNFDQINRKPLGELAAVHNQPVPTNQQTSKGSTTDEDVRDAEIQSTDVASSVSWLTDRLNAARQLILDLGNQRLKQDACISQLKFMHQ
ncbi:uveal autoantigen with coiled-coil domains and ankyrin repeats protein, partial [Clonorchis sinensis]